MTHYRIKQLPKRFTFGPIEDGVKPVEVEMIGRGQFTIAYRQIDTDTVYLVVNDEAGDYSKDILADCVGPYFPQLDKIGLIGDRTVWRTIYYPRLKAQDAGAWSQYQILSKANAQARYEVFRNTNTPWALGREVIGRTIELVSKQSRALADVLTELADAAANYGSSYTFEFSPRNLATHEGQLILLDPIFNMETIERERRIRLSRLSRRRQW